jgi:hypothetical protein
VQVLNAIAGIAASAIQRAALHEQTEQRLQRLAALREIDIAIMNSTDVHSTLSFLLGRLPASLGSTPPTFSCSTVERTSSSTPPARIPFQGP